MQLRSRKEENQSLLFHSGDIQRMSCHARLAIRNVKHEGLLDILITGFPFVVRTCTNPDDTERDTHRLCSIVSDFLLELPSAHLHFFFFL